MRRGLLGKLLVGGGVLLGGIFFMQRSASASLLGATTKKPPVPPWTYDLDFKPEWRTVDFWQNIGATKAKNLAGQTLKAIHNKMKALMPRPSFKSFKSTYQAAGDLFGVPYELIRANHYKESYTDTAPLTMNDHSTALGLAQHTLGSCKSINLPYIYLLDWRVGIWTTAAYLKHRGWNKGTSLPTLSEIQSAAKLAGTKSEPAWFKAQRGYWGAYASNHAKFEKSVEIAAERLTLAHKGFDSLTKPGLSMWYTIPNEARLTKFLAGTASSINWNEG